MWYLYKITNLLSGKVYIGQAVDVNRRWDAHRRQSKIVNDKSQYIHRALANLGRKASEETKVKLRGRIPHNKCMFTQEELDAIIADTRSQKAIAKALGINHKTVARIKKYKK